MAKGGFLSTPLRASHWLTPPTSTTSVHLRTWGETSGVGAGSQDPGHLYELLLDGMLCWLYFDIEYSREANPDLELEVVMAAFHKILKSFARETLDLLKVLSHRRVGAQPEPMHPLAVRRKVRQVSRANAAA